MVHLQWSWVGTFAWLVSHSVSQEDLMGYSCVTKTKLNSNKYSRIRPFGILKISYFVCHCPSHSIFVASISRQHCKQMRWRMYLVEPGKVPGIRLLSPNKRKGYLAGCSKRRWKERQRFLVVPSSRPQSPVFWFDLVWSAVEKMTEGRQVGRALNTR